jgi:hypothetical protein
MGLMIYLVLILIFWYITGLAGFIFHWTSDYDLTTDEIPMMLFSAIIGPLTYPLGAYIHGKSKTILKRRD